MVYKFILNDFNINNTNIPNVKNIDINKLIYLEYKNKGITLQLCFYSEYLIGIKFIQFEYKNIEPTHKLRNTIIWDNFKFNIDILSSSSNNIHIHWFEYLDKYFNGNLHKDNLKNNNIVNLYIACPYATAFQIQVWQELLNTQTISSYGDIANNIGRINAVRAVGTAVSQNPIAIIIPCHRILPKYIIRNHNDTFHNVGEYMSGSRVKRFLLNLEKNNFLNF